MKKIIFSLSALAALLLAGSCQRENLEPVEQGNTVTYTVQVPGALATKAANGFELLYEVYRQDNTLVYESDAPIAFDQEGKVQLSLEFVKGQTFTVLFWAQNSGCTAYNVGDLRSVTLAGNLKANDENAEAFAGKDVVTNCVSAAENGNVVLVRPIAQLNIATLTSGLTLGEGTNPHNVDPGKIMVKVVGLYNTYNVATSEASGTLSTDDEPLSYAEAVAPKTPFNTDYTLVGSTYVGFIPSNGATVNVDFTINADQDGNINHKVSNVPVKPNYKTNIIGNLISATADYNVTLGAWADAEITHPMDGVSLQTALDNAVPGTTIQLEPGVDYGVLYLRPSANTEVTKTVDWIGNNYGWETYSLFENITIKGAKGATIDAIEIEGGTYYKTPHSQSSKYPIMLSLIELKNIVIDGVTFTGKGGYDPQGHGNAINLSGNNIKVDGLTIQNCTLNNPENNARLIYKTESTTTEHKYTYDDQTKALKEYTFTPSLKNIKVTGTTFNGGYMGLELRETENVTITENEFNVADRNILLAVNTGCTYSGKITITGNVSNNAKERFVRMSGAGDAEVVIENNTINNYQADDADYIKVTNANNVTLENNFLTVTSADDLQARVNKAAKGLNEFAFASNINGDVTIPQNAGIEIIVDGRGFEYDGTISVKAQSNDDGVTPLLLKNINFKTNEPEENFIYSVETNYYPHITVSNCTFEGTGADSDVVPVTIKSAKDFVMENCTAIKVHSLIQNTSGWNITIRNCEVTESGRGMSLGTVQGATIENVKIGTNDTPVTKYGIRINAEYDDVTTTIDNCKISAFIPVVVRKASANYNLKFSGSNNMTATNTDDIWCAIGTSEYETNGTKPTAATGKVTVTLEDSSLNESGIYGAYWPPVAKVGNKEYGSIDEAIEAWTNNTTLTLLDNVTLSDVVTLKSTEHHILNLGTYTMTAASDKNAFEIKAFGTGDSERFAITIKADANNPGGIDAGNKSIVYYDYSKGEATGNDRPIIKIEGGVFTASTSPFGTAGIYVKGSAARKCATINISGGVFNCTINGNGKSKLIISGGLFHYSVGSQGDSTANRLISGGTFKTLGFMTADSENTKFWFGTSMGNSNVGLYINDDNYLVVGGPVITDFGDKFAAKATNATKWSNYLQYSSAAANGLYYTNADLAIEKHGAANVDLK